MQVKTHSFNGRKYRIIIESLDGWCDIDDLEEWNLIIGRDLNRREGLITAIHEALHAERWDAKEQVVERVSKEIGSFLWRLGFRYNETKIE